MKSSLSALKTVSKKRTCRRHCFHPVVFQKIQEDKTLTGGAEDKEVGKKEDGFMEKYRTFKVEIAPTAVQKEKIAQFQGICRFVYNLYLAENDKRWKAEKEIAQMEGRKPKSTLMSPSRFYAWLKREYIPETGKTWISDCSSKAIRNSLNNANRAYTNFFKGLTGFPKFYTNFFKGLTGFPKFKKKKSSNSKIYFCRNDPVKQPTKSTRWYVQVPKLGRIHLKEKGRIPDYQETPNRISIVRGHVYEEHGRWYMTVLVEYCNPHKPTYRKDNEGIGIDVGLKSMAVLSDGTVVPNINKKRPLKRKMRKFKHLQRIFSRKMEAWRVRKAAAMAVLSDGTVVPNINKKRPLKRKMRKFKHLQRIFSRKMEAWRVRKAAAGKLKAEKYPSRKNLDKAQKAMNACQRKINNTRESFRKQTVAMIMNKYPSFIVMEDLNISGMMKNKKLAYAISQMQWYTFRWDIQFQCAKRGIEFRLADRFFPSSRTCPKCGHVHERTSRA